MDPSRSRKTEAGLQVPPAGPVDGLLAAALEDLDRLTVMRPELEALGQKVASLIKAAFQAAGKVEPSLDPESDTTRVLLARVVDGWNAGVHAARVITPAVEPSSLRQRILAIHSCGDPGLPASESLRGWLEGDPGAGASWAIVMLTEGLEELARRLAAAGVDPAYAASVIRLGILGELNAWSARVTAALADTVWPHGVCPVCGAAPALAEARGLEQRRFLRCGWCGGDWPFARGRCPSCGLSDPRRLRYLSAEEDQGRYRLVLCDGCGGRLKVVATLAPLSAPGLVVAELATLHLDLLGGDDLAAAAP